MEESAQVIIVRFQIVQQLYKPFLSFVVGGDGGLNAEGVDIAYLVDVDGAVYSPSYPLITRNDTLDLHPRITDKIEKINL